MIKTGQVYNGVSWADYYRTDNAEYYWTHKQVYATYVDYLSYHPGKGYDPIQQIPSNNYFDAQNIMAIAYYRWDNGAGFYHERDEMGEFTSDDWKRPKSIADPCSPGYSCYSN